MYQQIDKFIQHLEIKHQHATNTLQAYSRDLRKFVDFNNNNNISKWSNLTKEDINLFIMQMRYNNISSKTIRRYISSIKGFLSYLVNKGLIKDNCAQNLRTPKIDKNLPKTLDYKQIEQILLAKSDCWTELRDIAIIEVFYSSALRLTELTKLNIEDIDLKQGFLQVTGKGAKMRHTPLGKLAQKAIDSYLKKINSPQAGALFISNRQKRINPRTVQNMIKKRALDVGIKINMHPHMLRHAAASHFLQSSGDLIAVQDYLGHKSIKSTQIYTNLDFLALAKVYDKCHPRAKNDL